MPVLKMTVVQIEADDGGGTSGLPSILGTAPLSIDNDEIRG